MSKCHDATVAKHGRNGRVFFIPLITISLSGVSPEYVSAVLLLIGVIWLARLAKGNRDAGVAAGGTEGLTIHRLAFTYRY